MKAVEEFKDEGESDAALATAAGKTAATKGAAVNPRGDFNGAGVRIVPGPRPNVYGRSKAHERGGGALERGPPVKEAQHRPPSPSPNNSGHRGGEPRSSDADEVYGALDLGTNNCRLLLARPTRRGFRVIDSFSRIIRLGEGVSTCGTLSEPAMRRTIEALKVCSSKLERHGVKRARLVATEACRFASNGQEFLDRVRDRLGLDIEVLTPEAEARLAVSGCASLIDQRSDYVLVFDIGGGSSELIWLNLAGSGRERARVVDRLDAQNLMAAWTSLPVGVVTLAEKFGGRFVTEEMFEAMVTYVLGLLQPFEDKHQFGPKVKAQPAHLLGTSGTVTTIAGIRLGLPRYDRNRVDGCWLDVAEARDITYDLVNSSYEERVAQPCIGRDRADLVLAGCAILEALIRLWPCERLRVADRGLREGILTTLMIEDGVYRSRRRSGRSRR